LAYYDCDGWGIDINAVMDYGKRTNAQTTGKAAGSDIGKKDQMKHNLENLTLEELQVQRQAWLDEYKSLLDTLARAVLADGKAYRLEHRDYCIIIEGSLTFRAREITERYDTVKDQYITAYQVSVYSGVKQVQVACYTFFADPAYPSQWASSNFIVPGDWLKIARRIIDNYQSTRASQEQQDLDAEREKLLTKLLSGIDI
jgi:hypothetical protein